MGKFLRSVLLGIGIGLLVAPMPGQEMRRLLNERFQSFLGSLSESQQPNQQGREGSGRVSPTERTLREFAEEAFEHKQPHSPGGEPFTPSYPEYVNPETNPNI